jgi:hypothetical protein
MLIIIILFSINLHGQNDTINKINDDGLKFGYWKEYHGNGKIKTEGNYKIIKRELSNEEKFFYDEDEYDSVATRTVKVGEWKIYDNSGKLISIEKYRDGTYYFTETYFYDDSGEMVKTERNAFKKIFGKKKSFEFDQLYFFIAGRIGNTEVKKINVTSLCDLKTDLIIESSSDRIKIREEIKTIEPNSRIQIPFTFSIQPDSYRDYIEIVLINSDTTSVRVEVESFGYHLSSHDLHLNIVDAKTFRLNEKSLLYFREFEECEMKIFNYEDGLSFQKIENEKIEPIIIFPLSIERNEIDFTKFKKGEYLLTTIDYRNDIEMMIKLIKE